MPRTSLRSLRPPAQAAPSRFCAPTEFNLTGICASLGGAPKVQVCKCKRWMRFRPDQRVPAGGDSIRLNGFGDAEEGEGGGARRTDGAVDLLSVGAGS